MNPPFDVAPVCDGITLPAQTMGKRVTQKSKDEFAALLKLWRKTLFLSQSKGAQVLGIASVRTLQNWEIGRTAPQGPLRSLLERQLRSQLPNFGFADRPPVRRKARR